MIRFFYETDFKLARETKYTDWIIDLSNNLPGDLGDLHYIFMSDEGLLELNQRFLGHDYYTDILSFPGLSDKDLSGEIYISVDRVKDNAKNHNVTFDNELLRVMAHGLLHFAGYTDNEAEHQQRMRQAENEAVELFHVKH